MNDRSQHIKAAVLFFLYKRLEHILSFWQQFSSSPSPSSCAADRSQSECCLGRIWSRTTELLKTGVTWQIRKKSSRPGSPWHRSMVMCCQIFQWMNCIKCLPRGRMLDRSSLASVQAGLLTCQRRRFWNQLMTNCWNITVPRIKERNVFGQYLILKIRKILCCVATVWFYNVNALCVLLNFITRMSLFGFFLVL